MWLDEYKEAGENIRHYSTLRFTIFTLFFAIFTGLSAVAFSKDLLPSFDIKFAAKFFGLLFTIAFLVIEWHVKTYVDHFVKRAKAWRRNNVQFHFACILVPASQHFSVSLTHCLQHLAA